MKNTLKERLAIVRAQHFAREIQWFDEDDQTWKKWGIQYLDFFEYRYRVAPLPIGEFKGAPFVVLLIIAIAILFGFVWAFCLS